MRGAISYSVVLGIVGALCIVAALAYVVDTNSDSGKPEVPAWVTNFHKAEIAKQEVTPVTATPIVAPNSRLKITPGVERWYTHKDPEFSFRLPDDFTAPDIDMGIRGVSGVRVSNAAGSELVVYVYPVSSGSQIDAATISSYLKGETQVDLHETVIGTAVRGFRFISVHADGARVIHLWAAYGKYVYIVQAPEADEDLFNFVTQNWFFTPATPSAPQKK